MEKTYRVALAAGILAMFPLAYALFSNGGFEDGTFHGWAVEQGLSPGLTTVTGSALMGDGGYGMAFGIDGRPENTGNGYFATCLAFPLALFLLPVWLLKRHHRPRHDTIRTIQFLPRDGSFHLTASARDAGEFSPKTQHFHLRT
ncbi:MAG TPA: hypothetical protein VK863_00535 [Candidatus Limnocylindrales bacterium]|nr:hypothetical protein [Candidatus Limnocylindrales bacterium]